MRFNLNPLCLIIVKPDIGTSGGETIMGLTKGPVIWMRQDIMDTHPDDAKKGNYQNVNC